MLHVNLLKWRNLIGSLSRDIGQYPMIDISNSIVFIPKCQLITTNKPSVSGAIPHYSLFTPPFTPHRTREKTSLTGHTQNTSH